MESIHRQVVNCNSYAKGSFSPSSVPLFSNLIQFWTVGFRRFHHFWPLLGRLQQWCKGLHLFSAYPLFSNPKSFWTVRCRRILFNSSMVNFTDECQIPGSYSMSALRSFVSSRIFKLPNFVARGMASPVRLLHRVQLILALLHFAISVFQEVSVNSFPVTHFLMAIQVVTGLQVLLRRHVTGFLTSLLVLVHSYSHFVSLLDTWCTFHSPAITM